MASKSVNSRFSSPMNVLAKKYYFKWQTTFLVVAFCLSLLSAVTALVGSNFPAAGTILEESVIVVLLCVLVCSMRSPKVPTPKMKELVQPPPQGARKEPAGAIVLEVKKNENSTQGHVNPLIVKLVSAARASDPLAAQEAFDAMSRSGVKLGAPHYGALITAYAKALKVAEAEHWLNALIDSGVGNPNVICVNVVIGACSKAGACQRAFYWLDRMSSIGLAPDIMTYNSVIDACARDSDVAGAVRCFEQLEAKGLEPNVITFSSILHACARAGDCQGSEKWLQRALDRKGIEPNDICYNAVIHAWTREGDAERAAYWVAEMRRRGVKPTVNSYSTLLALLATRGDMDAAEATLGGMLDAGVHADIVCYNIILRGHSHKGNEEQAYALFQKIKKSGTLPTVQTFNVMLNLYAQTGNAQSCKEVFNDMRLSGISPDVVTFNTATKVLSHCGVLRDVEDLFEAMLAFGLVVDVVAFNAVIMACYRAKDTPRAESWLKRLIRDKRYKPNSKSYGLVIEAFAQAGDMDKAEMWLDRMLAAGHDATASVVGSLVEAYEKKGDETNLKRTLTNTKPTLFNTLVSSSARKGDVACAKRWWRRMLFFGAKVDVATYTVLVHAFAKADNLEGVEECVAMMEESGVCPNFFAYNSVIGACARCGAAASAEKWFDRMQVNGITPQLLTYNSLINAFAKAGDLNQAEKWLQRIKMAGLAADAVSYSTVIQACIQQAHVARAECWLEQMLVDNLVEPCPAQLMSLCYNNVVEGLSRAGDLVRAAKWAERAKAMSIEITPISGNVGAKRIRPLQPRLSRDRNTCTR